MYQAYLTIDLDYWNNSIIPFKWIENKFESIPNRSIVLNHHEVLPHLNFLKCTHLVNVDWHSDLAGYWCHGRPGIDSNGEEMDPLPPLNCGTWVDWVQWKNTAQFTWVHPNEECAKLGGSGRCEGDDSDAFELGASVWKRIDHYNGGLRPRLPLYVYVGVNLCLSNEYLEHSTARHIETIEWFSKMGKKHKMLDGSQLAFLDLCRARRCELQVD